MPNGILAFLKIWLLKNQLDKEKEKVWIFFYLIIIPFSVPVFNFTWLNEGEVMAVNVPSV